MSSGRRPFCCESCDEMFDATKDPPNVSTGFRYPGCTQEELQSLRNPRNNQRLFANSNFRPIPVHIATAELEEWLSSPRTAVARMAINNLQALREVSKFWPDAPIKAFHDFDRAYFGGALSGRVELRWLGSADALRNFRFHALGVTCPLRGTIVPMAKMVLNAQLIFLVQEAPSKAYESIGTLLHEMIHAYFYVRCANMDDPVSGSLGIDPGHGICFDALGRAISRRSYSEIGYKVFWERL